ncbi:glutamate synthase large subunit [Cellulosilyticum sp. I15G10I2]|uniref:glutamate synthase large subunit n=1 Tax=Cellulosilyticum sp. I15G10I2 TaxID=1892843 RepID=UPI00085C79F0|nr:glutamate synthase large subunit [Cellulosilyticum sp. I15G10I2]
MSYKIGFPKQQGLYNPDLEKDNCGVGFIASIKGKKSHDIVSKGLEILVNLTHRGATGCDENTGDGAGILTQIPHEFFKEVCKKSKIELPNEGDYAVGMIFLPRESNELLECEGIVEGIILEEGLKILGWRDVPVDHNSIGEIAKGTEPLIKQVFIARENRNYEEFERRLYIVRKLAEKAVRHSSMHNKDYFYIPSLSSKVVVYKGLLLAEQIGFFYKDLKDPLFKSALALVHQRYSTNTFPTWDLAQPFRYIAHNGEINTINGNRNWMHAREGMLNSEYFGSDIEKLFPIITPNCSDSASFDNAFELLVQTGRSLTHAMMMLIPEAWQNNVAMAKEKRAFYNYHATALEAWDGPAAVAFTNGSQIAATLDRNGLRPARYVVTKDDTVILASETGVLEVKPSDVAYKGRLEPGKMFLVDLNEGRIIGDEELKQDLCKAHDYTAWISRNKLTLSDFSTPAYLPKGDNDTLLQRQQAFGYTHEDLKMIIAPMAKDGKEPIGSMGTDTPLAVLSDKPQLLYNYFKQLFAQVTNPPIDPIREELVMSLVSFFGQNSNLLKNEVQDFSFIQLEHPILSNEDLEKISKLNISDLRATKIPTLFKAPGTGKDLETALDILCERAKLAILEGYNVIILSDRNIDNYHAPIPTLLAVSALNQYLIREKLRTNINIVVETGEAREVMHFALLIGYGATAINPYLAFETIDDLIDNNLYLEDIPKEKAHYNYMKSIKGGLLKVISKMGISTIQSYRCAQIFEAIGLNSDLISKYFTGTASRIEGIGLDIIAKEAMTRHIVGYAKLRNPIEALEQGGQYHYRRNGEKHLFSPNTIAKLQQSTRSGNFETFKEFSQTINDQSEALCTIRGLLSFKKREPIPLETVEPAANIVKRFATGAMSFGSISKEAHETIAKAMNALGGRSNTGEGGEDTERFADDRRSSIKQIASGRFGVTTNYLVNADELQIKMAQGAKPGEGGQLPGKKVNEIIGKVRHSTPGIDLISPPPHHDIYSIEDLAQLIHDLKNVNPLARISVKLVSEVGVGTVAAGVAKAKADVILISGHDGGTGASPLTSLKHAGVPWELGLSETQQVLLLNDLRSRVRIQTDGQLKTGRDVVIAALLGAEEFGFSTAPLVVSGCIMMRKCHLNTCPVGVATQDPELRKKFTGKPEHLIKYFFFVAEEVRELMATLGFRTIDEMIGRVDILEVNDAIRHWKTQGVDLSAILYRPNLPQRIIGHKVMEQDHNIDKALDHELIAAAKDALSDGTPVKAEFSIRNVNRTVGTMLSGEIAKCYGNDGLPEDTITYTFTGSAGQSFGAFAASGFTMILHGDANDYVGKGLSGGKIIIRPDQAATFEASQNIIVGNTLLYGATSGQVYINGRAGERFCVRNSGATAVVEGIGDHGCEYMTGGRVLVLGGTGRNFAAGMSGGIAYVYDEFGTFERELNREFVELEKLMATDDEEFVKSLINKHIHYTESKKAKNILENWSSQSKKFYRVISTAYKAILENQKKENKVG